MLFKEMGNIYAKNVSDFEDLIETRILPAVFDIRPITIGYSGGFCGL